MPIEVVDTLTEDIYQKCKKHGVPPAITEILIKLSDQQRTLERAISEQQTMMAQLVEAMKLNQLLYKNAKESLAKIEKRYSDPNKDIISSQELKDQ